MGMFLGLHGSAASSKQLNETVCTCAVRCVVPIFYCRAVFLTHYLLVRGTKNLAGRTHNAETTRRSWGEIPGLARPAPPPPHLCKPASSSTIKTHTISRNIFSIKIVKKLNF